MTPHRSPIRDIRNGQKVGIRSLADQVGCDRGYLSRLERGLIRKPDPAVLERIAKALTVPLEAIHPHRGDDVSVSQAPLTVAPLDPLKRYTPEEVVAKQYLPYRSARVLREKCHRHELRCHDDGGRITFTADDIVANSALGERDPFTAPKSAA